ncbi:MAG TPA: Calx-beta domain-containing protein, partial [Phycisphaerae bacterium]|nr:Calx-beta domain-containing protein [Phycisphaerae bacterium]
MYRSATMWVGLTAAALVLGLSLPSTATDYYVSPTGSDANDGLTELTPFLEIQTALNAATSPGDTIYVMPGLHIPVEFYTSSTQKRLRFMASGAEGSPITLTTLPGATQKAIIDLRNVSPEWWGFSTNNYSYITVDGAGDPDILDPNSFLLEITNVPGFGTTTWCFNMRFGSNLTLRNVALTDADQGCMQHSIYANGLIENVYARNRDGSNSHVLYFVADCDGIVVRNCHFSNGGKHGVQINGAQPGNHVFDRCIVHDNKGAPFAIFAGTGTVIKNSFLYNIAGFSENPELVRITPEYSPVEVEVTNCSLYTNAPTGYPAYMGAFTGGTLDFQNCVIYTPSNSYVESGNTLTGDYNLFYGGTTPFGTNTFSGDPIYVNPAIGDLHISDGSAAMDVASATYAPAYDIDNETRPDGGGYDLGADECVGCEISPNQAPNVYAGPDQEIWSPNDTVNLDGTVSDDGKPVPPGAVTTTWSKVIGPAAVTFGDPNAVDTTATFTQAGEYVLKLEAYDGEYTTSDTCTVWFDVEQPPADPVTIQNPWIVNDRVADCRTLTTIGNTFINSYQPDGVTVPSSNEEKAINCYDNVKRRMYHWGQMPPDYRNTLKNINVFGWALCGSHATWNTKILEYVDGINGRRVSIASGAHTCYEAQYDGAWHFFDTMCTFYVFTRGASPHVASGAECAADHTLITQAVAEGRACPGFLLCGDDPVWYANGMDTLSVLAGPDPSDHSMDMELRTGESITRTWESWDDQHCPPLTGDPPYHHEAQHDWKDTVNFPYWEPYALYGWEGKSVTYRRFANGTFVLEPDFRSAAYQACVESSTNIATYHDDGLTPDLHLATTGSASIVFHIDCPFYLTDGWIDGIFYRNDNGDANRIYFSDNGTSWTQVWDNTATGTTQLEGLSLRSQVYNRFREYWIKIELDADGSKTDAGVSRLAITTVFEHNKGAMAYLDKGQNNITVTLDNPAVLSQNVRFKVTYKWKEFDGADWTIDKINEQYVAGSPTTFAINVGGAKVPKTEYVELSLIPPPTPDGNPPGQITDLAAANPDSTTIDLTWTAPGDDGYAGRAMWYDLRYSTSTINEANWASATQVDGEPSPQAAGNPEAFTVTGLNSSTTYYFAIKTYDEGAEESPLSNVASETTAAPDVTAPAAITDLVAEAGIQSGSVELSWTAPGDDGSTGTAASYDIRYSTSTINEANWAGATQVSGEPAPQSAGSPEQFTVTGLTGDTTYYFAIKSSDEVPNESALSNVPSAVPPVIGELTLSPTKDAYVVNFSPDSNYGASTQLVVTGYDLDPYYEVQRTFAQFNVASIAPGTSISSAKLRLFTWSENGGSAVYAAHQLTRDFVEGEVTWNSYASGQAWTNPGGDYSAPVVGQCTKDPTAIDVWMEWDVTAVVQSWVDNPASNYGLALKVQDETVGVQNRFRSSEYGSNGPELFITDLNSAPAVDAGADQQLDWPTQTTANLDGTVTDDGLPDPPAAYTVLWTKDAGPGNVTFGNDTAEDTTATFDAEGVYILKLEADDSELTGSDTVTISVLTPDVTPPGDITDLSGQASLQSYAVDLTWTAPGDDGSSGTASTYDVRYSTSPIDAGSFDTATQATGEPAPQAAGLAESFTVTGLAAGQNYYFAVKTADEVPNWSGLSNVANADASNLGEVTVISTVATYLSDVNPDTNYGTDTNMWISGFSTFNEVMRSLVKFDVTSIPPGTNITSAKLMFYTFEENGGAQEYQAHELTQVNWTEDGVTWNTYDGSNSWTSPGGDYDAAVIGTCTKDASQTNYWLEFDVTATVQDWINNPSNNLGVLVKAGDEALGFNNNCRSDDAAEQSLRPKLVVTDVPVGVTVQFDLAGSNGDESVTPANLSVSLSQSSGQTVTVDYAVTGGTATGGGVDYTLAAGTLTFDPNDITKQIAVGVVDDGLVESDETIEVTLSNPTNATLGTTPVHTYTINDNDALPTVAFDLTASSGDESATPANLSVSLSAAYVQTVTVDYAVTGGTATGGGVDYTLAAGTLTFDPNDVTKTIDITIVDDGVAESDETIEVTLSNPTNATLGTNTVHTYTINDNDVLPSVQFDLTASAGDESVTPASLAVSLSAAYVQTVTVDYAVTGGTATGGGVDYTLAAGTLTFDPNDVNKTINITIVDDGESEADETIEVTLSNPSNATLGANTVHTYTINDNDAPLPTVQYDLTASNGDESVTPAQLTVVLSEASGSVVTVDYAATGGTATEGVDYIMPLSGSDVVALKRDAGLTAGGALSAQFAALGSGDVVLVDVRDAWLFSSGNARYMNYGLTTSAPSGSGGPHVQFFDLSAYAGATINKAELRLSCLNGYGTIAVAAIKSHAWAEGNKNGDYPGNPPAAPGACFAHPNGMYTSAIGDLGWGPTADQFLDETENGGDIYDLYDFFSNPTGLGFCVGDVTSVVQDWASGTKSNYGFYVNRGPRTIYLSEAGTADQPVLFLDYSLPGGQVTFQPGQTSRTIDIDIVDDGDAESDETIEVTLSNPSNATLGANTMHTYTINDNDGAVPPTVQFDLTSSSGGESVTPASLAVSLSAVYPATVTVDYAVTGGDATGGGVDYTLAAGTLTFDPNDVTKTVDITIVEDGLVESDETIEVTLSNPSNATLGVNTVHTYTINDNDALPTVAFDLTASAGAESVTPASLAVSLSAAYVQTVTVDYAVTGGTATGGGVDYTLAAGTLTFDPNDINKTIDIAVVNDGLVEADETIEVTLSNPTNATLGVNTVHTYTINDNDVYPTVEFDLTASSGDESVATVNLSVSLSAAYDEAVTVDFAVTGGTAVDPDDFTIAASPLTFNVGVTQQDIVVTVVDDALVESDETIEVTLSNPSNATLGANTVHTYTINDNDVVVPEVQFDLTSSSDDEGVATVNLSVSLDQSTAATVTVDFAVTGGNAVDPDDYSIAASPLTFNPGVTQQDIVITVVDDGLVESDETIEVTLSNPSNATLGANTVHTYTILDNDVAGGTGLTGAYYDNIDFTAFALSRVDATVNFNWGSGSPDPSIGADTFSIRWTGQVQPLYSETYTFYTNTDDGVRLWVDGQLIVDHWVDQGPTEWSGTIALSAGVQYDIEMEYYENGGDAVAELRWSSASQAKEIIPQTQLYPGELPPPTVA